MAYCGQCGTLVNPAARFCDACGAPVSPPTATRVSTRRFGPVLTLAILGVAAVAGVTVFSTGIWHQNHGIPFSIKSDNPEFAVLATMSGVAKLEPPFLKLSIDATVLRTLRRTPEFVRYVRIGLAHMIDQKGAWDVVTWSEKYSIDLTVGRDSTEAVPAFELNIPVDNMAMPVSCIGDLKGYWLVAQVGLGENLANQGWTYAHSDKRIFE